MTSVGCQSRDLSAADVAVKTAVKQNDNNLAANLCTNSNVLCNSCCLQQVPATSLSVFYILNNDCKYYQNKICLLSVVLTDGKLLQSSESLYHYCQISLFANFNFINEKKV